MMKKDEHTKSYSSGKAMPKGRTDWQRVDALSDDDIRLAVAEDEDAALLVDAKWFEIAELVMPGGDKERVTIRLDKDMVSWFKGRGRGYQTRINAVLRAYMEAHKKAG